MADVDRLPRAIQRQRVVGAGTGIGHHYGLSLQLDRYDHR